MTRSAVSRNRPLEHAAAEVDETDGREPIENGVEPSKSSLTRRHSIDSLSPNDETSYQ
ncbi:hypothetical protein [Halopiger djelfimassiliensis]|uniref:hypothetical protein n=1 Tax=Halopiger djelfimassiliensis TaxID=1293047 RepID=UPI000AB3EAA3|nr:hypothetical protein [Halopiger djelfimassiliensis]